MLRKLAHLCLITDQLDAMLDFYTRQLGLSVVGTLGVLELAAKKGLIILKDAISELGRTTFRAPERLIAELLERDEARKRKP